jgi:hypothetical protein
MTREVFAKQYGVDPATLNWQDGWNSLFRYVIAGPYTVYQDDNWGYYVEHDGDVYWFSVDLTKYLSRPA